MYVIRLFGFQPLMVGQHRHYSNVLIRLKNTEGNVYLWL